MTDPKNPTEPNPPWSQPTGATPATPPASASDSAPPLWPPTPARQATASTPGATVALDVPVAPVSTVRRAPRRRRGLIDVVLVVATVFAVSGVGFAIGRVTAPASAAAATAGRGNGQFPGGAGGTGGTGGTGANGGQFPGGGQGGLGAGGGVTISGEVVEVTADHLTLKLANGQSIQIGLSGTTTYHSQAPATAADVTPGSTVQVQVSRAGAPGGTGGAGGPGASARPANGRPFGSASDVTVVPK